MQTNEDIVDEILKTLPPAFYGQIELHITNGVILYAKTISSKKYNTESQATGVMNGSSRK